MVRIPTSTTKDGFKLLIVGDSAVRLLVTLGSALRVVKSCRKTAHEGFCEDLARQTAVTHLSQLQLGFRRRRIRVSVTVVAS